MITSPTPEPELEAEPEPESEPELEEEEEIEQEPQYPGKCECVTVWKMRGVQIDIKCNVTDLFALC